jgi:GntR family transcriptional regulator
MAEMKSLFSEKQRSQLSKESPTPLYFQLYKLLKNCILDGTFENGMRLPTEKHLSAEFGISRITAKRSLDELADEGLVERHRGKGTHVIYQYKPSPVRAPLVGMLQEIESMARNSRATILDSAMLQLPQQIRDEFGLEAGDTALYLERVREREGLIFGYYTSWTVGVKKPRNAKIFEKTPRLSYFRQNGLEITHVKQTISAVGASSEAAEAIGVEPGSPLLSLTRRSYNMVDDEEHLMDYLQVLYHPERFQYRMDLRVDEG